MARRMRSEAKTARTKLLKTKKKASRLAKYQRERDKWTLDEEYQKKQEERLIRLKAKSGYEKNIQRGKEEKEKCKKEKKAKLRRLEILKRKIGRK